MNDKIMLIAISGDGNKPSGSTTIYLHNPVKNYDTYQSFDYNNEENKKLMNDFIETDIPLQNESKMVLHINLFKEYLKETRKKVFTNFLLSKFDSYNESTLFSLFSTMGNVIIQVSEYATLIYIPKNINIKVQEILLDLKKYSSEDSIIEVMQSKSMKDKNFFNFSSYEEFLDNFITKGKTK